MKVQNIQNAPKVPIELEAHILHSEKPVELVHLLLRPGEQLAGHKNPFDVVFFVIEGSGILTINGESKNLKATDTLKVTSEINRGWKNKSDKDLKILVIKLL
ncbi:MAG: cupin domain-containing protein [Bacteroidota bacterium]|nr:cupin domain-containing protein [Bacteroidota bacterium]